MTRDDITKRAEEATKYVGGGSDSLPVEDAIFSSVKDALEEAALICESVEEGQSVWNSFAYHACAAAIREYSKRLCIKRAEL